MSCRIAEGRRACPVIIAQAALGGIQNEERAALGRAFDGCCLAVVAAIIVGSAAILATTGVAVAYGIYSSYAAQLPDASLRRRAWLHLATLAEQRGVDGMELMLL